MLKLERRARYIVDQSDRTGPRQSLVSGDRKLVLKPGAEPTLSCRYALVCC